MSFTAAELLALVDRYDRPVVECATGQISFRDFLGQYGAFYLEHALDGHEYDADDQQLLRACENRIALHQEITESVLYRLTSPELLAHPDAMKAGFIDDSEGLLRLKRLALQYLHVNPSE